MSPPPAAMFPGCGAPCGGNIFTGGGDAAAAAATVATAATVAAVLSSAETLINSYLLMIVQTENFVLFDIN